MLTKPPLGIGSIPSYILAFHIVHESFIHHFITTRCGIVTCKIPIAKITWAGSVKIFYGLINNLDGDLQVFLELPAQLFC